MNANNLYVAYTCIRFSFVFIQPEASACSNRPVKIEVITCLNRPVQCESSTCMSRPVQREASTCLNLPVQREASTCLNRPVQLEASTRQDCPGTRQPNVWLKESECRLLSDPYALRIIDWQLWCCCSDGGIYVFDEDALDSPRVIPPAGMARVYDVAALSSGDVVIAADTGLYEADGTGNYPDKHLT